MTLPVAGEQFKQNHCDVVKPTMPVTQANRWGIVKTAHTQQGSTIELWLIALNYRSWLVLHSP